MVPPLPEQVQLAVVPLPVQTSPFGPQARPGLPPNGWQPWSWQSTSPLQSLSLPSSQADSGEDPGQLQTELVHSFPVELHTFPAQSGSWQSVTPSQSFSWSS